jgi:uncharacterized membrane protein YfhO
MEKQYFLKDKYFWTLIVFMGIVSGVLFFDFIVHKRLFIFYDIGGDTRQSYWPMYHYIVEGIRDGTLRSWSFQMGLGTSTFTLYSFLFDPFIILFLLFPIKYLTYGILVGAIVKIFIAGILFYLYMNLLKIKKYPAVISALVWAFNGYMMLWGQHYWFATMIVFFTFIMLALEMWLRGKRPFLFPISITIMGINSPYFLFMISLFIFFYVIFHYIFTEKFFKIKELFFRLVRFFGAYFIGLGASAVVFLPVSYLILSSPRTSGAFFDGKFLHLATYIEYISMFLRLFSNNTLGVGLSYFGSINYYEGPLLSTSLLFIILLPQLLFVKATLKNKIGWILAIVLCLVLLIFPFFSTLFSAFSSFNYRWNFLLIFLNVLTIGYMLHYFSQERKVSYLGLSISALVVITGWYYSYKIMTFQSVIPVPYLQEKYMQQSALWIAGFLSIYAILFIVFRKNKKLLWILLLCTVTGELIKFNYPTINDRITVPVDVGEIKEGYFDYTNEAVKYIKKQDEGLFRIDKNYDSYSFNDSLIQNFNGVNSYNSLNQSSYINFFNALNTGMYDNKLVSGFDYRPALRDLTGVKYILSKDENVPSEYIKLTTFGDVNVYKNPNALPIGFMYDSYVTEKEFKKLMPFEKDDILLHAAVLKKGNHFNKYTNKDQSNYQSINIKSFTILNDEMKDLKNNQDFDIITASNDPWMGVELPENNNGWKMEFEIIGPGNTTGQIFWANGNSAFTPENAYTFEVFNKPVKLAYELNIKNMTKLRFDPGSLPGTYLIRNFKIVPVKENKESINSLLSNKVDLQEYSNSYLKGNVNVDRGKMLFFSIPYDKGWTLKIDGKKVSTEPVNIGFTGAKISKGNHLVELEYHQPLLKIGIIISFICWGIIFWRMVIRRKSRY